MGKDLVKMEDYAIIKQEAELREVIKANLGSSGLSAFDLDRIRIPSGGGNSWTIPSIEGDTQAKEIAGVIVFWKDARRYWKEKLEDAGEAAPDCYSEDALNGFGSPGGVCEECPFSKFGSSEKGGQACQLRRQLYLMRSTDLLPVVLDLPVTSLMPIRKYFLRLASAGIPYWGVETGMTLNSVRNAAGIKYSIVSPTMKQRIGPETVGKIRKLVDELKPALTKKRVKDEDKKE